MFENIRFILSIIPLLIEVVKQVETLFPESGVGRQKLEFVKNMLTETNKELEDKWPILEKLIAGIVNIYNKTGFFQKQNK